jgi:hypothetical protein
MTESLADRAREAAEQRRIERGIEVKEWEEREKAEQEGRAVRELRKLLGLEPNVIDHDGTLVVLEADGLMFKWRPATYTPGMAPNPPGEIYLEGEQPIRIRSLADLGEALNK